MNKQQLASKIWESANRMRSKIEAHEYKDYILGFIFYKYLSDTEVKFCIDKDFTPDDIKALSEDDTEAVRFIQRGIGYFIAYENLFSTWIEKGRDFDVSNVRDALSAFSRLINASHRKVYDRILDTLQTGLSKLGDSSGTQTKAISDLIQLIKDIPMDEKQDYDVLGFIYEYLISMFAANAGKKAGEFYTPHEVSLLMSEIVAAHLQDRTEIKIYDPTSGSGSLLINIGRSVAKHMQNKNNIKYYAQEIKENTYNLTRMNLVMRGILPDNIVTRNGDTLEEDWPFFEDNDPINTYNPLYVDAVVSNPPYSQLWDPANRESDPRYARFGLAPKSKADYAFLLHDLFHLKADGIMTIVLPHGVLFRGGSEGEIRKNLIEQNHIDTIIGLPANIFFGTGIPTIIMVLKKNRVHSDVLIIDASKGFIKSGKNNTLRASDIKKIADTVISRASIEKYSRLVSQEEIRSNEYNLNIPRYVDSSDSAETWDIYASMFGGIPESEIAQLKLYWETFTSLKGSLFTGNDTPYSTLAVDDIKKAIEENRDVIDFKRSHREAFGDFAQFLSDELIENMMELNINKEETVLSNEIFRRLEKIAIVDKYNAFQVLNDEWVRIAADLEVFQTEGFSSIKKVNPNIVLKKKDGKDQGVQEGYIGYVIPFELVQSTILADKTMLLKQKEERLSEIQSSLDEIIESFSEEEKESGVLNEAKDSFIPANVSKRVKELFGSFINAKAAVADFEEESFEKKLIKAQQLIDKERDIRLQIKEEAAALHLHTKETIENLTDEQAKELLTQKWINPLIATLQRIPDEIVSDLALYVQNLADKYATTYAEVARQIAETKSSLSALIDELTGSEYDMKGLAEFQALLKGE